MSMVSCLDEFKELLRLNYTTNSSVKWSHLGQILNFQKIDLGQLLSFKKKKKKIDLGQLLSNK